jgi:phasin family protein
MANKTGNPFLDQDFSEMLDVRKYMEHFQMPGLDNKALMEAHRKNLDAVTQANRVAFEGAQALARRQAEIVREAMDEAAEAMQQVQHADTNEERVAKQTEIAKKTFETALKHMRELAEMSAKSQNEALELINGRVAESFDEMRESMQSVVKQTEKATASAASAGKPTNGSGASASSSGGASKGKSSGISSASTSAS